MTGLVCHRVVRLAGVMQLLEDALQSGEPRFGLRLCIQSHGNGVANELIPAIDTFDLSSIAGPPVTFGIAPTDTATWSRPVGAVSGEAAIKASARRYQTKFG